MQALSFSHLVHLFVLAIKTAFSYLFPHADQGKGAPMECYASVGLSSACPWINAAGKKSHEEECAALLSRSMGVWLSCIGVVLVDSCICFSAQPLFICGAANRLARWCRLLALSSLTLTSHLSEKLFCLVHGWRNAFLCCSGHPLPTPQWSNPFRLFIPCAAP